MDPADGGPALADQLVHVDGGDQSVVDHDHHRPRGMESAGHEAEVGLVERHPVPAVDEDLDGRRARPGIGRQEHVESLPGRRTVAEVETTRQLAPGALALRRVAAEVVGEVRDLAPVVVLAIEGDAVVVEEDGRAHALTVSWTIHPGGAP